MLKQHSNVLSSSDGVETHTDSLLKPNEKARTCLSIFFRPKAVKLCRR